jgi:cytochrome c peroxidase
MSGGRIPVVRRNSPTILNTAFNGFDGRRRRRGFDGLISPDPASAPMFWDSRVRSLEIQALDRSRPWKRCEARRTRKTRRPVSSCNDCGGGAEYVTLFEDAFGAGTTIDATRLAQAIAAFE